MQLRNKKPSHSRQIWTQIQIQIYKPTNMFVVGRNFLQLVVEGLKNTEQEEVEEEKWKKG